jgi:hypothetical protein
MTTKSVGGNKNVINQRVCGVGAGVFLFESSSIDKSPYNNAYGCGWILFGKICPFYSDIDARLGNLRNIIPGVVAGAPGYFCRASEHHLIILSYLLTMLRGIFLRVWSGQITPFDRFFVLGKYWHELNYGNLTRKSEKESSRLEMETK